MTVHPHPFDIAPISRQIWEQKYRLRRADGSPVDLTVADTWARIAGAIAQGEGRSKRAKAQWGDRFAEGMADFGFLPAGRIIAGAGAGRNVTLFNCFVMGRIEDDLSSIFGSVREAALTMQSGGGIGCDFSTLRPRGALVRSIGADASGPVSFMDVWDAMCRTIMSAGARRGAMMATMRCDHPDIEMFIAAKAEAGRLRNFNLSVLVTDAFIAAVRAGSQWELKFGPEIYSTVDARSLWRKIMRATYDYAEPGVIFIDRINSRNNLSYCEEINATNPCGEQPLPAYGACLLGSINLARLVADPFGAGAGIDIGRLEERVRLAVRFLDDAIEVSRYPLSLQAKEAKAKRRIGLGITGLADALISCGLRYGEQAALATAEGWIATVQNAAYVASAELAAEKGSFPLFDAQRFLAAPNVAALPPATQALIARHGIRNGCLTSIAPTGTISLLAGNVSSGVEPVFDFAYDRRILGDDGVARHERVEDYAVTLHGHVKGAGAPRGAAFVTSADLAPAEHLAMQAAMQRHVDSSISKTINCPADLPFESFEHIYLSAYDQGLKGCTTFRPNAVTGSVLTSVSADVTAKAVALPTPVAVAGAPSTSEVVYLAKPLAREPVLAGFTYKLKWPGQDNALYVTINDTERAGRRVPFEIFINTKNLEHYAWTVALTRMISAIFRRGGEVAFVVEELKAIFDPQGGRWIEGRYVPSLLAAIGEVIETHLVRIGFMRLPDGEAANGMAPSRRQIGDIAVHPPDDEAGERVQPRARSGAPAVAALAHAGEGNLPPPGRACPRCNSLGLVRVEGCWSCRVCGYARCD